MSQAELKGPMHEAARLTQEHIENENAFKDTGDQLWNYYDSDLKNIEHWFSPVLPEEGLKKYIEKVLERHRGNAIGLEIGGPGSKLFADFSPGFFKTTIGTTLVDARSMEQKGADEERHHTLLEADIFSWNGYKKVLSALNGQKAHFIVERMYGGLTGHSDEPAYLLAQLDRWYRLSAEESVLLFETPVIEDSEKKFKIDTWLGNLRMKTKRTVRATCRTKGLNTGDELLVCIERTPGSPDSLLKI